jgi:HTH-type transcriptional regulator/antitoxin MqsA
MQCGFCENGTLREKVITREFQRDGYVLYVPNYRVSECDACGSVVTTAEQAKSNQRAKHAAEAAHMGLLSGEAIRSARGRLGLSQAEASEVFGGGPNSFYKYERSEVIVSKSMDLLIRVADEFPSVSKWLFERAQVASSEDANWSSEPCPIVSISSARRMVRVLTETDVAANGDWDDAVIYESAAG